jgi:uncharacterized cupin superfamily protein
VSEARLHRIAGEAPASVEPIAPDRLIEGAPATRTVIDYQRSENLFVGEWSSDVGAWRVAYDEWEFCHILEGVCELTPDGGAPQRFRAGESFIIEPGFTGIWRVCAPMRKKFVIRTD